MASRRGPDHSVRVAISGKYGTTAWANVFWCNLTTSGSISQADLDTWLSSFQAAFKTRFAPRQSTGLSYSLAVATLFQPGGTVLQSTVAMTGNGTGSASGINDLSCAKIVSWLTTVYWRGGKPRTYIAAPQAADSSDARTLTGAEVTALQTAAAGFRTDINALAPVSITGTTLGFVSFTSGNAPRGAPLFFAFTGAKVHPRLGTQRRRLGKWIV